MQSLSFLIWTGNAPCKSKRPPNRTPNTRHKEPSFELLVRAVQETPKTYGLLLLPLVTPQGWKFSPYCRRHQALQNWDPEAPKLKLTCLRTSFYSTRRCFASFQRREATNSPTPLMTVNHKNKGHSRGTHTLSVTNSSLTGLKTHSTRNA